jgi:hypothetical protein
MLYISDTFPCDYNRVSTEEYRFRKNLMITPNLKGLSLGSFNFKNDMVMIVYFFV